MKTKNTEVRTFEHSKYEHSNKGCSVRHSIVRLFKCSVVRLMYFLIPLPARHPCPSSKNYFVGRRVLLILLTAGGYLIPYTFSLPCSAQTPMFYGMTSQGGTNGFGVIFEWDPATNVYTKKQDLSNAIGSRPLGSLVIYNNMFYGMTVLGGTTDVGVIFEWDPAANVYTKKQDLSNAIGKWPYGFLTIYNNNLYGMIQQGGANGGGVIFEWDPAANIYTKKQDLSDAIGKWPLGSLALYNNKFYGMTSQGGITDEGVIFEWDPATNIYTKKQDLSFANGRNPYGSLTLYNNKFYGMTCLGGANNKGVIFEWDPATNIYTKKQDLSYANGDYPYGLLALYNNKFYGMTNGGGVNGEGVIFEWDPATNIYTKKQDLSVANGKRPQGSLVLYNSKFYGMTYSGGATNEGVIFEWDPATNIYTKKQDLSVANGGSPWGDLVLWDGAGLPVQLLYFTATAENNIRVRCEWATASEFNNSHFDVERSKDGVNFEKFGKVDGAPGGNSSVTLNYVFYDHEPYTGVSYYRLKQVDFNGQYEYSPERAVYIGTIDIISIFPNPATEYIEYLLGSAEGGAVTIKLYDALGREVYNKEETIEKGVTEKKLSTANLSNGNYLLRITNGSKEKTQKQFVIK